MVPAQVLKSALEQTPNCEAESRAMASLIEARHEQVKQGLPLTALPIGIAADDVCARATALQAECIKLSPGEIWEPLPDSDPCGPHFTIIVKGRLLIEKASDGRQVMHVFPGGLVSEGLAAQFDSRIVATTYCEAYRMRSFDFLASVATASCAEPAWLPRFELLEKKSRADMFMRLQRTKGCAEAMAPHPCDKMIENWKRNRQEQLARAKHAKMVRQESLPMLAREASLPVATQSKTLASKSKSHASLPAAIGPAGGGAAKDMAVPSHGPLRAALRANHDSLLPRLTTPYLENRPTGTGFCNAHMFGMPLSELRSDLCAPLPPAKGARAAK
eukprot:gnl/TRDRNA2_/TRDRNA2_158322_c0_seq1.p1 gnl/TRDRNA2_/TRDRNA2_158322_c0~~gnl/TRDRNA2_/TRDRNA2_158322_c0_seq1.p1  ORF type:complete len:367 (-),score=71.56 gnl/TRDRNA2_/TRDRNA2_158322_c0_seq1:78-1070(-)